LRHAQHSRLLQSARRGVRRRAVPRADPDGQLASTKGNIAGRNKSGPDTGQRARTPSNNKEKTTSGGPNPDAGLSFPFWPRLKDSHHMIGNWMA